MKPTRVAFAVALVAAVALPGLAGCAASTAAPTTDPSARQRVNAEKQQALQEMLEKGQR